MAAAIFNHGSVHTTNFHITQPSLPGSTVLQTDGAGRVTSGWVEWRWHNNGYIVTFTQAGLIKYATDRHWPAATIAAIHADNSSSSHFHNNLPYGGGLGPNGHEYRVKDMTTNPGPMSARTLINAINQRTARMAVCTAIPHDPVPVLIPPLAGRLRLLWSLPLHPTLPHALATPYVGPFGNGVTDPTGTAPVQSMRMETAPSLIDRYNGTNHSAATEYNNILNDMISSVEEVCRAQPTNELMFLAITGLIDLRSQPPPTFNENDVLENHYHVELNYTAATGLDSGLILPDGRGKISTHLGPIDYRKQSNNDGQHFRRSRRVDPPPVSN